MILNLNLVALQKTSFGGVPSSNRQVFSKTWETNSNFLRGGDGIACQKYANYVEENGATLSLRGNFELYKHFYQ